MYENNGSFALIYYILYTQILYTYISFSTASFCFNFSIFNFYFFRKFLAVKLQPEFSNLYERLTKDLSNCSWDLNMNQIAKRALRNACLSYITLATNDSALAHIHYNSAENMNDRLAG